MPNRLPEIDHEMTPNIVCPYCGYKEIDSWQLSLDSGEIYCNDCEHTFHYERDLTITYTTSKIE